MAGRNDAFTAGHGGAGSGDVSPEETTQRSAPISPSTSELAGHQGADSSLIEPGVNGNGALINNDPSSPHYTLELPADRSAEAWKGHRGYVMPIPPLGRARATTMGAGASPGFVPPVDHTGRPYLPHRDVDPFDSTVITLNDRQKAENAIAQQARDDYDAAKAKEDGQSTFVESEKSKGLVAEIKEGGSQKRNRELISDGARFGGLLAGMHATAKARVDSIPDEHPLKAPLNDYLNQAAAHLAEAQGRFKAAGAREVTTNERRSHLAAGYTSLLTAHAHLDQPMFDHDTNSINRGELEDNARLAKAQKSAFKPVVALPKKSTFAGITFDFTDPKQAAVAALLKQKGEAVVAAGGASAQALEGLSQKGAKKRANRREREALDALPDDATEEEKQEARQSANPASKMKDNREEATDYSNAVTALSHSSLPKPGDMGTNIQQPRFEVDLDAYDRENAEKSTETPEEKAEREKSELAARQEKEQKTKTYREGIKTAAQIRAEGEEKDGDNKRVEGSNGVDTDTVTTRVLSDKEREERAAQRDARKPVTDIAPANSRTALFQPKEAPKKATPKKSPTAGVSNADITAALNQIRKLKGL